ncbi:LysR family transcriptional regulator [Alloacidobacterium sp.]|uniref:LysR family transcriptional regulator n=1 Tax=Alloacidobacterium sp. TaxID=2951999 RepID=UPI002D34FAC2|nr:LysR family transcriptional regulator [Alloacidobacterium sp.]HYK35347.1 LysR family transcriptional regulator [Alloacidobacterium sp.]
MDFEQLRTFLEVSRLKSFSRAAEKLGVTQPAISAQIRSLENEAGARLFDRDGGKVTFTAAGRLFEPFAEHCLQVHNHIMVAIGELHRSPRGEISISANEATSLYVLPAVFAQFKKQYTRVNLSIVRADRARSLEAVLNREVDFGIVSQPVKDPRLTVDVIHKDDLVLVVPRNHPLAARDQVKFAEILQYPLLLPKHGRQREQINDIFRANDVQPRVAMEVDSSELLKRLIGAGLGMGFLPRSNVRDDERNGLLKTLRIEGVRLSRELALVYRKDKTLTRAAIAFLEIATGRARPVLLPTNPKSR